MSVQPGFSASELNNMFSRQNLYLRINSQEMARKCDFDWDVTQMRLISRDSSREIEYASRGLCWAIYINGESEPRYVMAKPFEVTYDANFHCLSDILWHHQRDDLEIVEMSIYKYTYFQLHDNIVDTKSMKDLKLTSYKQDLTGYYCNNPAFKDVDEGSNKYMEFRYNSFDKRLSCWPSIQNIRFEFDYTNPSDNSIYHFSHIVHACDANYGQIFGQTNQQITNENRLVCMHSGGNPIFLKFDLRQTFLQSVSDQILRLDVEAGLPWLFKFNWVWKGCPARMVGSKPSQKLLELVRDSQTTILLQELEDFYESQSTVRFREFLAEIERLKQENERLHQENDRLTQENKKLRIQVASTSH